jgi:hypothetical protein
LFRNCDTAEMTPETPLLKLLRCCTVAEQHELARLAGTTRNYLYQMAGCHRKEFSASKVMAVSEAATRMHVKSLGRIPKISAEAITAMCSLK